jgi:hypothetical protein
MAAINVADGTVQKPDPMTRGNFAVAWQLLGHKSATTMLSF